jgi:SNF2 family DNA or RNA helicase
LKVPHTGTLETFKNNFAGRNQTSDLRLQTLLRQIMIRRTHLDTIFGRPLLQLPGISTKTVTVEFNKCEKAVYNIVKNRFIAKIRFYAKSGNLDKKFQSIFVLYLRLRQLTGHILLIQQTLKDLMEGEDLEKLWRLTENEVQPQREGGSQAVLGQLRKMLSQAKDTSTATSNEIVQPDSAEIVNSTAGATDGADAMGGTFGMAFKFRKYLRSLQETGKWDEVNQRSLCHKCGGIPDNPHITSCFHVYCKECLEAVLFDAAKEGKGQANCLACNAQFERAEPCHGFNQAATKLSSPTVGVQARRARRTSDSDEADIDWLSVGGSILPSAKTLAVKAQIQLWVEEDPSAKIIIFTQFRDMIRILSRLMQEEQWGCAQFHGSMSFAARDKALVDFAEKDETKVLLASLKAGGVGLNLTMASKVIIVDLWWNESVESQAFCRCFRIGQDRPVDICRIGMLGQ